MPTAKVFPLVELTGANGQKFTLRADTIALWEPYSRGTGTTLLLELSSDTRSVYAAETYDQVSARISRALDVDIHT